MNKENCFEVELLRETSVTPKKQTELSTGFDLYADLREPILIEPFDRELIPAGFKIRGKKNIDISIRPRSGLAVKQGITVLNAPGTIDPDYTGEVKIPLINLSTHVVKISPGERIAQMIIPVKDSYLKQGIVPINTERGENGFGSTGNK